MTGRPFPIDFSTLEPDTRPRTWLVLPSGFDAKAACDEASPHFTADPETLLEAFIEAALSEPRTELVRREGLQAEIRQESKVLKFKDYVTVEARAHGDGSELAVYSRSMVGFWDLNVNRKRVRRWIEMTQKRL